MKNYIYHIRYKEDNNNIDNGYIGLTNNPINRKSKHWAALHLNIHKNYKLQEAFNKKPDDFEFVFYKEFNDRKDAALLEETLRPLPNIGWNIAVGGERVYEKRFEKKIFNIENDFIDHSLLQEYFLFKNYKFSSLKKISRFIFKNTINRFIASKQSLILNNLFSESYFFPELDTSSIIIEAWQDKEDIFFGKWNAIPHDMIAVAYALCIQIKRKKISNYLKINYFLALSNIINQIFVNGKLFEFNQIDAILIDIIIIDYFVFLEEIQNDPILKDNLNIF